MQKTGTRRLPSRSSSAVRLASTGDRIFYGFVMTILTLFMLIVLLPLLNIVACSFSGSYAVIAAAGGEYFFRKRKTEDWN